MPFFETPTGWKFFGNLMDSHLLGGKVTQPAVAASPPSQPSPSPPPRPPRPLRLRCAVARVL